MFKQKRKKKTKHFSAAEISFSVCNWLEKEKKKKRTENIKSIALPGSSRDKKCSSTCTFHIGSRDTSKSCSVVLLCLGCLLFPLLCSITLCVRCDFLVSWSGGELSRLQERGWAPPPPPLSTVTSSQALLEFQTPNWTSVGPKNNFPVCFWRLLPLVDLCLQCSELQHKSGYVIETW